MKKLKLEIELTDNTLDNIIKMAPYLDEKSQDRVFGMMLEAVKSLEKEQKAGQEVEEEIIVKGTTERVGRYLKENNVNLKKLSRDSGITYELLYASVRNKRRVRELRVDEFLSICEVLDISANVFKDTNQN